MSHPSGVGVKPEGEEQHEIRKGWGPADVASMVYVSRRLVLEGMRSEVVIITAFATAPPRDMQISGSSCRVEVAGSGEERRDPKCFFPLSSSQSSQLDDRQRRHCLGATREGRSMTAAHRAASTAVAGTWCVRDCDHPRYPPSLSCLRSLYVRRTMTRHEAGPLMTEHSA